MNSNPTPETSAILTWTLNRLADEFGQLGVLKVAQFMWPETWEVMDQIRRDDEADS